MTIIERARAYLGKMDAAVSGSGGHNATFKAACVLVHGFELGEAEALGLLQDEFNPRCSPRWSESELRHKVQQAGQVHPGKDGRGYLLGNSGRSERGDYGGRTAENAARKAEAVRKKQEVDEKMRARLLANRSGLRSGRELMERSPVDVQEIDTPEEVLNILFKKGERALVFTNERSQGDFGYESSGDLGTPGRCVRLGERPSVEGVDAKLPRTGRCGVWFLAQPVDGKWRPNGRKDKDGQPFLSRRSGPNVAAWRYMLLEADDGELADWISIVSQLPLAVAAIYSSGGRSAHVLVRVDAACYSEFYSLSQKMAVGVEARGGCDGDIRGALDTAALLHA